MGGSPLRTSISQFSGRTTKDPKYSIKNTSATDQKGLFLLDFHPNPLEKLRNLREILRLLIYLLIFLIFALDKLNIFDIL